MNDKDKKLAGKIRDAELAKDAVRVVHHLEDYFRNKGVDLFWFAREVEKTSAKEQIDIIRDARQIYTVMDKVGAKCIEDIEKLVIKGAKYDEQYKEQVDTLLKIKQEMADVYVKLLNSLP